MQEHSVPIIWGRSRNAAPPWGNTQCMVSTVPGEMTQGTWWQRAEEDTSSNIQPTALQEGPDGVRARGSECVEVDMSGGACELRRYPMSVTKVISQSSQATCNATSGVLPTLASTGHLRCLLRTCFLPWEVIKVPFALD
jgi:hypothetical protein